jgi:hypothetical protein
MAGARRPIVTGLFQQEAVSANGEYAGMTVSAA